MNFEQFSLDFHIIAAVKAADYTMPTPIQRGAIPIVLRGRDVLGLAQTGTGKTAAFVLPILQRLTRGPSRQVRALIVAPTRELAEQIHQTIADLGRNGRVRSVCSYGGVSKHSQAAALRRGGKYDILIATDIAARGIDVSQISHTINFDMPDTADACTHGIGCSPQRNRRRFRPSVSRRRVHMRPAGVSEATIGAHHGN